MYPITAAHLLLGPSVNNYKELYSLHFVACDNHSDRAIIDDRMLQKTKRSLIHKLIEVHNNINYDPPIKTNLFVVLSVSIQPMRILTYGKNINRPIVCIGEHKDITGPSDHDDDDLRYDDNTEYDHNEKGVPDDSTHNSDGYCAPIQLFAFRDSFKIKKVKPSKMMMHSNTPKPINLTIISSDHTILQSSTDMVDKYNDMDDVHNHDLKDYSDGIVMSVKTTTESVISSSKVLILKKGIKYLLA